MHYINLATLQYPVTEQDIRQAYPDTAFGVPFLPDGYTLVSSAPQPAYDPITQSVREITPVVVATGNYEQRFEVVELYPTQAEKDAAIAVNLALAKATKWEAIKASRDERKNGGALVGTKWFHTDADSRIQQLGLVLMGAGVPTVQWKTMDGTFAAMTPALAGQIFQAVAALDMALFANAEAHRAAMEASATPATYDFSTGWPEHFPI